MEEIWLHGYGTRRRGKKSICKQCREEFIDRLKGTKKFCSKKCASRAATNRIDLVCELCGISFERAMSNLSNSKSGLYFCSRKCKEKAQKLDTKQSKFKAIRPSHYGLGNGKYDYRARLFEQNKDRLECVGCRETKMYLLTAHHIDGNRNNNLLNNLEIVCHNCHAKRHMKYEKDVWRWDLHSLTSRDKLKEL